MFDPRTAHYAYRACWGTPGGGSPPACAVQTTLSTSSAIASFDNPSAGGRLVIMDYIRLLVKAADTGATAMYVSGMLDGQQRFNSGGFQPISPEIGPICVTQMNVTMPALIPHFGPLGLTSGGANRLLTHPGILIKNVAAAPLMVVDDELLFTFASGDESSSRTIGSTKRGVANAAIYQENLGPIVIEPGCNYSLLAWFPGISAGFTFEPECAWWEVEAKLYG